MKAFGLGSTGENVSTVIGSNPNSVNITAYGVLDPATGNLFVTIINKEHFAGAQNATVTLSPGAAYNGGPGWALLQTGGDVTSSSSIPLRRARLRPDGTCNDTPPPPSPSTPPTCTISPTPP